MLLDIDLQDIPGLKPASLHLRHFSCKPYQVLDTRAIFRVPFQGCGTTRESNSDYIIYENVVNNSKQPNATRVLIRHAQELRYPFSCRYRQKYFLILQEGQSGKRKKEINKGNGNSTREKGKSVKGLNPGIISKVGWVWLSGWTSSSKWKWVVSRQLMILHSGYWSDWSITSRCYWSMLSDQ